MPRKWTLLGLFCLLALGALWIRPAQARPRNDGAAHIWTGRFGAPLLLGTVGTPPPTPGTPAPFVPLITATPQPDGSIVHTVATGDTLWSIAVSYGVKIDEIRQLNDLPPGWTSIYEGQKLIIRPAGWATPPGEAQDTAAAEPATATITPTRRPTDTPRPTRTPRPSATVTPSPSPTLAPGFGETLLAALPDRRTLGLILLGISGIGIVLVLIFGFRKPSG